MTTRGERLARVALLLWTGFGGGCDAAATWSRAWIDGWSFDPVPVGTFVPPPTHLRVAPGVPFDLGSAQGCVAQPATRYFAEKPPPPGSDVPQDALVVRVAIRCESGQDSLEHVRFTWVTGDGLGSPATHQTTVPGAPEGTLQRVFELPKPTRGAEATTRGELRLRGPDGDLDILFVGRATATTMSPHSETPAGPSSACEQRRAHLAARLGERFARAPAVGPECNVLGWLVPSECPEAMNDPSMRADALNVARACGGSTVQALLAQRAQRIPDDFHLTLRRDRCPGSLDRCPRYTLALYGNGATVMHGKHWVTATGRSDGRTHPRLLAGLWESLREMAFLTRPGAFGTAAQCGARASDRGNLIRVQAAGKQRMVVDREGCRGPFSSEELDTLAAQVDAVAGVDAWTEARPAYADRDVQVWTVAVPSTARVDNPPAD